MNCCEICKKEFKNLRSLGQHLNGRSKNKCCGSLQEYYDRYLLKDELEKKCRRCGKKTTFCGLRGYTEFCSNDCVNKSESVKNRKVRTCKKNYNCENPSQSELVLKRKRKTFNQKYGVDNPFKSKKFKDKYRKTCLDKYGVDHWTKTEDGKKWSRETFISRMKTQKLNGEPFNVTIGKQERSCLNKIEEMINYKIVRNPSLVGYFPDGLILELKLIIEFDEDHHKYYIDNDKKKDETYKHYGYRVIRIPQVEWEDNENEVILKIQNIIKEIECLI